MILPGDAPKLAQDIAFCEFTNSPGHAAAKIQQLADLFKKREGDYAALMKDWRRAAAAYNAELRFLHSRKE